MLMRLRGRKREEALSSSQTGRVLNTTLKMKQFAAGNSSFQTS